MVSRRDVEHLEVRHILHSLAIAKFIRFVPGAVVMDLGTGGGFPGLPLAIYFPETNFVLVDSRGKKIMAVGAMVRALQLANVRTIHGRAEDIPGLKCDFVISRAVARMDKLFRWSRRHLALQPQRHAYPNGIIALKGGDLTEEMQQVPGKPYWEEVAIRQYFPEPDFEGKKVVYLQI